MGYRLRAHEKVYTTEQLNTATTILLKAHVDISKHTVVV